MKDQLKKRLLDLVFVALAGFLGLGGFYVYVNVRAHQALDEALLNILQQQAQQQPVTTPAPELPSPFDQELPEAGN